MNVQIGKRIIIHANTLCAIFQHYPESDWYSLPSAYIESPFLQRDSTVKEDVAGNEEIIDDKEGIAGDEEIIDDKDVEMPNTPTDDVKTENIEKYTTLPLPKRNKNLLRSEQTKVRNILKEIIDLTFHCEDLNTLKCTKTNLESIKESVLENCEVDYGLKVRSTPTKKQNKFKPLVQKWKSSKRGDRSKDGKKDCHGIFTRKKTERRSRTGE